MGSYEREQAEIAAGTATRGETARRYFAELDAELSEEESFLSHRPNYDKTLFAPENDDIYREFCAYVDLRARVSSTPSKTPCASAGTRRPRSTSR